MTVHIDDAEKDNLPLHVAACRERYQALHDKTEETRRRTWRIEGYAVVLLATVILELIGVILLLVKGLP